MMFLGIFRSDLQKIVKKGSKFGPAWPKMAIVQPLFVIFAVFKGDVRSNGKSLQ